MFAHSAEWGRMRGVEQNLSKPSVRPTRCILDVFRPWCHTHTDTEHTLFLLRAKLVAQGTRAPKCAAECHAGARVFNGFLIL